MGKHTDTFIGGIKIRGAQIDVYRRMAEEAPQHRVALRVKKGWFKKWLEATAAEAQVFVLLLQKAMGGDPQ